MTESLGEQRRGQVTAVVCAAFDPAADQAILAAREIVRSLGAPLPPTPPHRPHFTLSAARVDRAELVGVGELAAEVAARHQPIPLLLTEVGRFGRAGVVWLGPAPTTELAALQREVYRSLKTCWPPAFGERSAPALWRAHCTLATRLDKPLSRAIQAELRASHQPIRATVAGLATILVGGRGDVCYAPFS
ncbi:MAG: 2'-5' RNA ligase family protein [Actinomycetia bacterium]|nr:2'-5' RNA ligase family protein [Actinomycetes bacterium]